MNGLVRPSVCVTVAGKESQTTSVSERYIFTVRD